MFSMRAVMAGVYLLGGQGTRGLEITPHRHMFSIERRVFKLPQKPTLDLIPLPGLRLLPGLMSPRVDAGSDSPTTLVARLTDYLANWTPGNTAVTLIASAKSILGLTDAEVVSPSSVPEIKEEKPILVANAKMAPNAPVPTTEMATPAEAALVKEKVPVNAKETKPLAVSESKPEPAATKAAPTEKPSALSALWNATKEKAGNFYDKTKQQVAAYVDDAKTVTNFVKDETVKLRQDAVQTLLETKDKIVDLGEKVADKVQDAQTTVENVKVGLMQGLTGNSPVRLEFDQKLNDYTWDATKDPTYADYADVRNAAFEAGDYIHDRGLDFMDGFKFLITIGPGVKEEFGLMWLKPNNEEGKGGAYAVFGAVVGERVGFDGRNFVGQGFGKIEGGVKAGTFQLKPKLEVTKDWGDSQIKTDYTSGMDVHIFKAGKIGGTDVSGNVRVKENLTPEIGFSIHPGLWGGELKVRPYQLFDFVAGFFGFDPANDNEEGPRLGLHRPYREYLHTENGQPYLVNQSGMVAGGKRDEVPGLFVQFLGLSSRVAEGAGKTTNDMRVAWSNILNAGWQWTADVSRNAATNIHTATVLYRDDMQTVVGATVGAVKDVGDYATKKVQDGWTWSKERASAISEPYSKNVSASFNEMTRSNPVTANKLAIGMVASVFSGDIWDKPLSFTFDAKGPAVVTINGILNSFADASNLNDTVNRGFGIRSSAMISNRSHTKGLQDGLQVAFQEYFGAIDAPAVQAAIAIRQGIKEKGEVFVVAHSQGTAIFDAALDLLSTTEKAHIHYLGLGPEKYVSGKMEGLADAENVRNAGDIVPLLGNTARASNWLIPREWPRKVYTDWTRINRDVPGNRHGFDQFYKQEVKRWIKERDQ